MKRKVLSTILAVSMVATMVVGCGGGGDTQADAPAADAGTEAPAEGGDAAQAEAPSGVAADKEGRQGRRGNAHSVFREMDQGRRQHEGETGGYGL